MSDITIYGFTQTTNNPFILNNGEVGSPDGNYFNGLTTNGSNGNYYYNITSNVIFCYFN